MLLELDLTGNWQLTAGNCLYTSNTRYVWADSVMKLRNWVANHYGAEPSFSTSSIDLPRKKQECH
jgi:hypothetical protein